MSSPKPSSTTVDRTTTTPFLLRFSYRLSGFHPLTDFPAPVPTSTSTQQPYPSHLQIYTWPTCTLRELAHLLTSALPNILPSPSIGTRLSFRLVYPDTRPPLGGRGRDGAAEERGKYMSKEIGSVIVSSDGMPSNDDADDDAAAAGSVSFGGEDVEKTLADARFMIGDFVDCAVFPPLSDGSVAPRSSISGPRAGGLPQRENGYGRLSYNDGRNGGGYGGRGGRSYAGGRGDFGGGNAMPSGEWRRGERLPDRGFGGGGRGRGRGAY